MQTIDSIAPPTTATVKAARGALETLTRLAEKSGVPGGKTQTVNLQAVMQLESALDQLCPLGDILNALRQQSEIAVRALRNVERALQQQPKMLTSGDDGSSETAGK